jgi:hypothetical protein
VSIAMPPGGSETRRDTVAELAQVLEEIARATPEPARPNKDVLKRKLGEWSELAMLAAGQRRLALPSAPWLWSLVGLLALVCIGVVVARPFFDDGAVRPTISSSVDAKKPDAGVQQPSVQAQVAPVRATTAPISSELTQWMQATARELATLEQGLEQLKASQAQLAHDNAELAGHLKDTQEEMTRHDAELAGALKAVQEETLRSNLSTAEQLKASREQITSIGEQLKANRERMDRTGTIQPPPPRPSKLTSPTPPGSNAPAVPKPAAKPSSPQAGVSPKNSNQSQPKQH